MKVYSLSANPGDARYAQAVVVNYWFWERGYDVVPFDREQLRSGELDHDLVEDIENTIVYGAVAIVREAVERAGRLAPPTLDLPEELREFIGREVFDTTMGWIREWEREGSDRLPAHVKPRDRQKLFTGKVVGEFRDLIPLSGVPDEEPVIVQEIVELETEWRATVLRGRVVNVAHYKGNPMVFPDGESIEAAVRSFATAPIGYGMDWGVTSEGRTILIEVNDGFALGNYGVQGHDYTALIECRWRELVGLPDNGVGTGLP